MRAHDLQAYRKMDVTREHIRDILELREILLSFQTDFNLVNAAVVRAILESISCWETSLVITEPSYLKPLTVSNFCPFTFISVLMPLVFVFCCTDLHAAGCGSFFHSGHILDINIVTYSITRHTMGGILLCKVTHLVLLLCPCSRIHLFLWTLVIKCGIYCW